MIVSINRVCGLTNKATEGRGEQVECKRDCSAHEKLLGTEVVDVALGPFVAVDARGAKLVVTCVVAANVEVPPHCVAATLIMHIIR